MVRFRFKYEEKGFRRDEERMGGDDVAVAFRMVGSDVTSATVLSVGDGGDEDVGVEQSESSCFPGIFVGFSKPL